MIRSVNSSLYNLSRFVLIYVSKKPPLSGQNRALVFYRLRTLCEVIDTTWQCSKKKLLRFSTSMNLMFEIRFPEVRSVARTWPEWRDVYDLNF